MVFFQTPGILPDSQTCSNMAVKYDRRWGLNTKIDIWFNRQGQPGDFIILITFVTSRYVGGLVLNEGQNFGIQLGVMKNAFGLIFLKTVFKICGANFLVK